MFFISSRHLTNKLKTCTEVFTKRRNRTQQLHQLPSQMKCLAINNYVSDVSNLDNVAQHSCPTPTTDNRQQTELGPHQALVKVHAASINYVDLEILKGHGKTSVNLLRKQLKIPEFPLVLGRDYSGVIVAHGKRFDRFGVGDEVYGFCGLCHPGSHAEYVVVNRHEVSPKPTNLDFVEAASIPGVGCVAWSVLVDTGAISRDDDRKRRILIPGGNGGLGAFAYQLCRLHGHDVVTTCAEDAIPVLENLGLSNAINYQSSTYVDDLVNAGPFDVILGTLRGAKHDDFFQDLLAPGLASQFISVHPNFLEQADEEALGMNPAEPSSGNKVFQFTINQINTGRGLFQWGFNGHNGRVLSNIKRHIEDGTIKPHIDKVFPSDQMIDAYKYVDGGDVRGKTVIQMV